MAKVVELLRSAAPGAAAALSDFLTALMDTCCRRDGLCCCCRRVRSLLRLPLLFCHATWASSEDTIAAPTLGLEYLLEAVLAVKVAFEEEAWECSS